jgi:hypothetical protein
VLRLQLDRFTNQARQPPADRAKQEVDVRAQEARAELVYQCVVRRQSQRLRQYLRLVAREGDDLLQVRGEQREIILLLGFQPARFGKRRGACQPCYEQQGHRNGVVALAPHLTQVGPLPVFELRRIRLRTFDQARYARRGQQGVALGVERRELLAANVGAATRHHDGGIPAQDARRAAECMEPAEFLLELLVWSLCHGRTRPGDCSKRAARPARHARAPEIL